MKSFFLTVIAGIFLSLIFMYGMAYVLGPLPEEVKIEKREKEARRQKLLIIESTEVLHTNLAGVIAEECVPAGKSKYILFKNTNEYEVTMQRISHGERGAERISSTWTMAPNEEENVLVCSGNKMRLFISKNEAQPTAVAGLTCPYKGKWY